jgi:hypothetical protein
MWMGLPSLLCGHIADKGGRYFQPKLCVRHDWRCSKASVAK